VELKLKSKEQRETKYKPLDKQDLKQFSDKVD